MVQATYIHRFAAAGDEDIHRRILATVLAGRDLVETGARTIQTAPGLFKHIHIFSAVFKLHTLS